MIEPRLTRFWLPKL